MISDYYFCNQTVSMNYYEKGLDEEFDKECEKMMNEFKTSSLNRGFEELPCIVFDSSNLTVENRSPRFCRCPYLKYVNMSNIHITVTDMCHRCSSELKLDALFSDCPRVEYVKMSNMKITQKVE